jgi:hypothetical protein
VHCPECKGTGKAYGIASNGSRRKMNCKNCARVGTIPCSSCSDGRVRCRTCSGSGRFRRWLEVVEKSHHDVQIEPDGELTRPFAWGTDGTTATAKEIEVDARIVLEVASQGPTSREALQAASVPSEWLEAHWRNIQPKGRPGERARKQTFWLLEVPSVEVAYSLGAGPEGEVAFEGRRLLAPAASGDEQFAARARRIGRVRRLVLGAAMLLPLAYVTRGPHFWSAGVLGVALAALATVGAVDRFLREATLGHRRARVWAALTGVTAMAASAFAAASEPSLRSVRREIAANHFDAAGLELTAVGGPTEAGLEGTWADLQLARTVAAADLTEAIRAAKEVPSGLPQRLAATRHVHDLAVREITSRLVSRRPREAKAILVQALPLLLTTADSGDYQQEANELSAKVYDQEFEICQTDPCRLAAAVEALRLSSTAFRKEREELVRARLSEALSVEAHAAESPLERLQRLRQLWALAKAVTDTSVDGEVATKARKAATFALDERAKVALIGAQNTVAAELVGASTTNLVTRFGSVSIFLQTRGTRCVGAYIVGADKESRVLNGSPRENETVRALALALGRTVPLPDAPKRTKNEQSSTTRSMSGTVPIAARWRDGALVELRVGEVKP